MAASLFERFRQTPPGYCPGTTLGRALDDLHGIFAVRPAENTTAVLGFVEKRLELDLREIVERHFLMHIVSLEFTLNVPAISVPGARLRVRNTGLLRRTGIVCAVPASYCGGLKQLAARIGNDREVRDTLMKLDFRRCEIDGSETGWTVRIEPFGASEVVNRMPSFRRYIRLAQEQAELLVAAFSAFGRVLVQSGQGNSYR